MGKSLTEIANELKSNNKKVQLIYAFNGTGKTRLSKEFQKLIDPKSEIDDDSVVNKKILYYNAFTEDLFYWDNDMLNGVEPKLKIHSNEFTNWIFKDQGQDGNVIKTFQNYTDEKLMPKFNDDFSEIDFSYERGNDENYENIKISKGEESCFVWSVFNSLLDQVVGVLNNLEDTDRETDQFNDLEYVFIDDPVSSLDDNHLIELAVNLAKLVKSSDSNLKFIITTHNPLFYNVLHNEFKNRAFKKYVLKKDESNTYELKPQGNDSPFAYHLALMLEIEKAINTGDLKKYHFNYIRNILEKTATFLGYTNWGDLLPKVQNGETNPYYSRIINISSHSKHATDEITELSDDDKNALKYLFNHLKENNYHFQPSTNELKEQTNDRV